MIPRISNGINATSSRTLRSVMSAAAGGVAAAAAPPPAVAVVSHMSSVQSHQIHSQTQNQTQKPNNSRNFCSTVTTPKTYGQINSSAHYNVFSSNSSSSSSSTSYQSKIDLLLNKLPVRQFSVQSDRTLITVLKAELNEEKQLDEIPVPNGFDVDEKDGSAAISLSKRIGKELITINYNVTEPEPSYPPQEAQQPPEEQSEEQSQEQQEEEQAKGVVFEVTIRKDNLKSEVLAFSCVAENSEIYINQIVHTTEEEMESYQGPSFNELPEDLANNLLQYLKARGIDEQLADYLIEKNVIKEQKEYVNWLNNLHKFISK